MKRLRRRQEVIHCLVMGLLLLLLAACSRPGQTGSPEPPASDPPSNELSAGIHGTVVTDDEAPVEGAIVSFFRAQGSGTRQAQYQTTTDAEGIYRYANAPTGTYNILVTTGGQSAFIMGVEAQAETTTQAPTAEPGAPGTISGTVTLEGATNSEGAAVFIPGTSFVAYTDAAGAFTLSVPQGTYRLVAQAVGYQSDAEDEVVVTSNETTTVSFTLAEVSVPPAPAPRINSFSPNPIEPGDVLTIMGENFGAVQANSAVRFGNFLATQYLAWSATEIQVRVPRAVAYGSVEVTVGVAGQSVSSSLSVVDLAPRIRSLSPDPVRRGDVLTIGGENFRALQDESMVHVAGVPASILSWSYTEIQVRMPSGAPDGTVTVQVTVGDQTASGEVLVTPPPPSIASLAPDPVHHGQVLTIRGTNFGTEPLTRTVRIEGVAAETLSWSESEIRVRVPNTIPSGTVDVTVAVADQEASAQVTVTTPELRIHELSQKLVLPRQVLSIYGDAFGSVQGDSTVRFGDTPATEVLAWSDTELRVRVPAGSPYGPIELTVEVEGRSSSLQGELTILKPTTLSAGGRHNLALTPEGTVVAWGEDTYDADEVPAGLTHVVAVSAGLEHSLALKRDGSVVAWGHNDYGQIDVPAGLSHVVAIDGGGQHSLALLGDGTVVAWGRHEFGQTQVPAGLSNVVAIAAGGQHSLALQADGSVVAWGREYYGATEVPSGLADVVAISANIAYSVALRSDGTPIAWGTSDAATGVPADLTNAVAVSAGGQHVLASLGDGSVVAWGNNDYGQTEVPANLTDVVAISAGSALNLALLSDGSVVAWGLDAYNGTEVPADLVVRVP